MLHFRIKLGQPLTTQPEGHEAEFIGILEANTRSKIYDVDVIHYVEVSDVMQERCSTCTLMPFVSSKRIIHWEIIPENPENIGEGSFGTVILSLGSIEISTLQDGSKSLVFSNTIHPVKEMKTIDTPEKKVSRRDITREVELSKLAGVAKGSFGQDAVMDQMVMRDLGDSWDCFKNKVDTFSATKLMYLAAGGMHSLGELSEKGIVHDDIKEENLFFDGNFLIHLGDFGLSHAKKNPDRHGGNRLYVAPEVFLLPMDRNTKSDVFSLAIVILNVFTKFKLEEYLELNGVNLCDFLYNGHYLYLRQEFARTVKLFGKENIYSDQSFPEKFIYFCVYNSFLPELKNKLLLKEKQIIADTLLQCLDFYPDHRLSPKDACESFIWVAFRLFAREMGMEKKHVDKISMPKQYYYPLLNIFLLLQDYNLVMPENFSIIFADLTKPKALPSIALTQKTIHLINKRFHGDERSFQLVSLLLHLSAHSDILVSTIAKFHNFVKSLKRQNVTLEQLQINEITKRMILTDINCKVQALCLRSDSSDGDKISPKASLALKNKYDALLELRQSVGATEDFAVIAEFLKNAIADPRITSLIGAGYCLTIFGKSSDTKTMLQNMEKLVSCNFDSAQSTILTL